MSQGETEEALSEPRRKEIFLALVEAQDQEMSVAQSYRLISERFGLEKDQLRDIERQMTCLLSIGVRVRASGGSPILWERSSR